ncbi:AraC family transcriptional regulator [Maricurvus nonylphenolicus]|uniref:AraC family transcriptional regulator n=1 Tax=Maricurvus nonylphenolicus TaxID=1008307 RepID=UPI0036F3FB2A
MAQRSFTSVWVDLLKDGLQQLHVDVDEVFGRIVMQMEDIPGKSGLPSRVSFDDRNMLWRTIEDVSGDPDIGLHLGEVIRYHTGDITQYLFLSSATFGEAITRCSKYTKLMSDTWVISHQLDGESCSIGFVFQHASADSLRHANEATMVVLTRFFDYVTSGAFEVERIEFTHSEPASTAEHQRIFNCPISFGADVNSIWFPNALLDCESLHAQPAMLRMHEQVISEQLSNLERRALLDQVQDVIAGLLDHEEVSAQKVAECLNITPNNLRYQLSDMGTSFNQLFADYRVRLAKKLLAETDESIDRIVYLTGFSEPSPFYRAFKRWTGMTPIVYREKYGK